MTQAPSTVIATPVLEPVLDLTVRVGPPTIIGEVAGGERRLVPILGGAVTSIGRRGRWSGRVLPGATDTQLWRRDGVTELTARYVIETDTGALIHVINDGVRHGPPEAMARLRSGLPVDPTAIYFRACPRFETASPALAWLTRGMFVCSGVRRPEAVELRVFEVG